MAETWVIDCSAVAAFLLNEPEGGRIDPFIEGAASGDIELLAPALFWSELLNVLMMAERRGRISREQAVGLRNATDHLPVTTEPDLGALARRRIHEFGLAHNLTAYDAAYLELAERRGARLKTLDPDLLALRPHYPWIE
jgi:predicted nucleic acid-binding protein